LPRGDFHFSWKCRLFPWLLDVRLPTLGFTVRAFDYGLSVLPTPAWNECPGTVITSAPRLPFLLGAGKWVKVIAALSFLCWRAATGTTPDPGPTLDSALAQSRLDGVGASRHLDLQVSVQGAVRVDCGATAHPVTLTHSPSTAPACVTRTDPAADQRV
jgi:hypothetical protein